MSYRELRVDDAATVAALRGGARELPLSRVAGAEACEPGRPLRLVGEGDGADGLGLGVADPENGLLRLFAGPGERFRALGPDFFAARVDAAVALRRELGLLAGERPACRLLHGAGDGVPGLGCDRLGDVAVLWCAARGLSALARLCGEALLARAGVASVVIKLRRRQDAAAGRPQQTLLGRPVPEAHVVEERGVPFEVHALAGLNTGLFTDLREQRHALGARAAGRRVLNLFAYTGTISVVAARAGAAAVTSVDLSAGVLRWARDNFRLSGLDPEAPQHRFVAADVARFLGKDRESYDLIVLDPPTWSAARGATLALERDLPMLVRRCTDRLAPGGELFVACHTRDVDLDALVARGGLVAPPTERGGLPPDYPGDDYLQTARYPTFPAAP